MWTLMELSTFILRLPVPEGDAMLWSDLPQIPLLTAKQSKPVSNGSCHHTPFSSVK